MFDFLYGDSALCGYHLHSNGTMGYLPRSPILPLCVRATFYLCLTISYVWLGILQFSFVICLHFCFTFEMTLRRIMRASGWMLPVYISGKNDGWKIKYLPIHMKDMALLKLRCTTIHSFRCSVIGQNILSSYYLKHFTLRLSAIIKLVYVLHIHVILTVWN